MSTDVTAVTGSLSGTTLLVEDDPSCPILRSTVSTTHGRETMNHSLHFTVGCLYLLAGLLGLAGQSVLIWRYLKKSPSSYSHRFTIHISMAAANTGIVAGFPLTSSSSFARRWLFGHFGCQFYGFVGMLFGLASIYHLMFVTMDLFRHRSNIDLGTQKTSIYYKQSLFAWLTAAAWAMLPLLGWASYGEEPSGHSCTLNWQQNDVYYTSYVLCVTVACYLIPYTVMAFCVLATVRTRKASSSTGETPSFEKQLFKLIVTLMTVYLVMWSPYAILCLYAVFGEPSHVTAFSATLPSLTAKLGSCIIPVVYYIVFKSFTGSSVDISDGTQGQNNQLRYD